jgi:hypothetical protein
METTILKMENSLNAGKTDVVIENRTKKEKESIKC